MKLDEALLLPQQTQQHVGHGLGVEERGLVYKSRRNRVRKQLRFKQRERPSPLGVNSYMKREEKQHNQDTTRNKLTLAGSSWPASATRMMHSAGTALIRKPTTALPACTCRATPPLPSRPSTVGLLVVSKKDGKNISKQSQRWVRHEHKKFSSNVP